MVRLVRGSSSSLPLHTLVVVAAVFALALATFREDVRELAEEAEPQKRTEGEAARPARGEEFGKSIEAVSVHEMPPQFWIVVPVAMDYTRRHRRIARKSKGFAD
jgi:hypothetical protein